LVLEGGGKSDDKNQCSILLCFYAGFQENIKRERIDLNFEACEIVENNFNPFHFEPFTLFEKGGRGI
jgi:hypothetical protein